MAETRKREDADLDKGQISLASPIAKALLGREEGDEVVVAAQTRTRSPGLLIGV